MESQKRAIALWWTVPTIAGFLFAFVAAVSAQSRINLAGSGSNVAGPLFVAWTDEFNKKNPAIQVRYLPLSSEEGIEQIKSSSGDFAIGEIPLSQEQMHDPKAPLVQIPVRLVAVVPVYNVPGGGELRFSGKILAQIYLGAIKNWNDPAISRLNPDVTLPDLPIEVFHRDEGRGTSYIFTDFLSRKSPEFRSQVGKSASPKWPVGTTAKRSVDMVEKVKATPGAIGYVERSFAIRASVAYGSVQNSSGNYVKADPASMTAACVATEGSVRQDVRISLVDARGEASYSITGITWVYLPASGLSSERGHALKEFLAWVLEDGQKMAPLLGYTSFARQPRVQGTRKVGDGAIDKCILRRIFCETSISRYNIRNVLSSLLARLGASVNSGLVRPEVRYAH